LKKKEITQKQQQIRANYTDKIRRVTSASGSNAFSKLSRFIAKNEKDKLRKNLANELKPLEIKKNDIIRQINILDLEILELEQYILELESQIN
jgi:chromosome segregation ATPase